MIVVSNAGPLITLGKLGRLDLLHTLYGSVLVPDVVYEETVTSGIARGAPDAFLIRDYFLKGALLSRPTIRTQPAGATAIDDGEKATVQLAVDIQADLVLIDDAAARRVALQFGLRLKGSLGLILSAVAEGILLGDEAIALVERLKRRRDIWIANTLCDVVLEKLRI